MPEDAGNNLSSAKREDRARGDIAYVTLERAVNVLEKLIQNRIRPKKQISHGITMRKMMPPQTHHIINIISHRVMSWPECLLDTHTGTGRQDIRRSR